MEVYDWRFILRVSFRNVQVTVGACSAPAKSLSPSSRSRLVSSPRFIIQRFERMSFLRSHDSSRVPFFVQPRRTPRASVVRHTASVGEDERGTVLGEELARGVRARRCGGRWIVLRCRRQWIHGHLREVSARAVAVRESARARARWMRAGDRGVGEARRRARVDGGRAREDAWTRGCDENARVERFFCVCHVILRILD